MSNSIFCPAVLSLAIALCGGAANAAQESITASRGALLKDIETALQQSQVTIVEQAQTDRFAIIYATHDQNGSHLTVTLAQTPLEETRISITVASDSPQNEIFDVELLQVLIDTQK